MTVDITWLRNEERRFTKCNAQNIYPSHKE